MKLLWLILISLNFECAIQRHGDAIVCNGVDILDVGASLKGFVSCSQCDLPLNSLKQGFSIQLEDSNYNVTGFRVYHTNNRKEISVKDISGNKATPKNLKLLKELEVGNFIILECINIIKGTSLALSTSIKIYITD